MWEKTTKVLMRDGKIGWLEQGAQAPHFLAYLDTWTHAPIEAGTRRSRDEKISAFFKIKVFL